MPSNQTFCPVLYWVVGVPLLLAISLRASIACWHFCLMVSRCSSAVSLDDWKSMLGFRVVSYPSRIWLGDKPVVELCRLLCTAEVMGNQWVQSSGCAKVTKQRYCSTHWFFRSDRPLVWGWNAVERFCWMPSFAVRAFPKWDVNLGSQSVRQWCNYLCLTLIQTVPCARTQAWSGYAMPHVPERHAHGYHMPHERAFDHISE